LVEVSDYVSVSGAVGRLEKRAENEKFFKKLLNNTLAQIENRKDATPKTDRILPQNRPPKPNKTRKTRPDPQNPAQ